MKIKHIVSVWLSAAVLACAALPVVAADETGFKQLFNGKDLTGWKGNPELWSVKDGAIVGETTAAAPIKGNTFLIWKDGEVADFELRAEFKIKPMSSAGFANSGIQYRSKVLDEEKWVVGGYQADMEAGPKYTGILYDERGVAGGRGIMAERGEKVTWNKDCKKEVTGSVGKSEEIQAALKKDDWNEYVVIVKGNHFQHFINGKQTVDVTDECESKIVKSGIVALQLHAGQPMMVQFKNIRLKTLAGGSTSSADDLKKLQGVWKISGGEANGTPFPTDDIPDITVTVKDGTYQVAAADNTDRGSFTVDESKSPKEMNIRPETGNDAGQTVRAIYEINGDTFRACYGKAGGDRPSSFSTEPDSGRMMVIYKRTKP
jgi:uncharacterized protein (TIGR03067 family)